MSGTLRSKLALAIVRQQKYHKEVVDYLAKNGEYTSQRKVVGHNLLRKLQSNIAEFNKIDTEWTALLRTTTDPTTAKEEQKRYDKYALDNPDKDKVPYMVILQDLDEAVADVDTELLMIETALNTSSNVNSSSIISSTGSSQVLVINAPATETKKRLFSGDPTEYKAFFSDFDASVGSKTAVPKVTKLAMLKERLEGEAYNCVKLYNTDDGYDKALDKLKQRFGVDSDAVADLRKKLNSYVRNKEDLHEVRKAFDEFEYHLTTIKTYGEDIESSEFFEALKRKLPKEILLRVADYQRLWTSASPFNVTELRKAVDAILSDFERIEKLTGKSNRYGRFKKGRKSSSPKPKTVASSAKKDNKNGNSKNGSKPQASSKSKAASCCAFCEGPHYSDDCPVATSIEEAKECAAEKHLCYKCFRSNHSATKCHIKVKCRKCGGAHHTVYCKSDSNSGKSSGKKDDTPVVAVNHAFQHFEDTEILLLTNEVTVSNPQFPEKRQKVLAFIDPGSQIDLIDKELAKALKLPMVPKAVDCQGATGQIFTTEGSFCLNLHLQDGTNYEVNALGTKEMLQKLAVPDADIAKLLKNATALSEPLPITYGNPKLLLSMKVFKELVLNQRTIEVSNGFSIIYSKIGKLICGGGAVQRYHNRPVSPVVATFVCPNTTGEALHEDDAIDRHANKKDETKADDEISSVEVEEVLADEPNPVVAQLNEYDYTTDPRFLWELELMGIYDNPNVDERRLFLQRFIEKVFQDENGRIFTALPFDDESGLGSNYVNCFRRCANLSKKFLKDPAYAHLYKASVDEFRDKGFIEELDPAEVLKEAGTHFMPHSIVITPEKTTKARLVFDGSCVTERGVSLNQKLLVGDNRLPSLVGILLRARVAPIVVCSDIEKAFLQIFLIEESKKYVRFMFPKDITKPFSVDNMIIYQFRVVPFGLGCSSNLLAHAIEYHLNKYAKTNLLFAILLLAVLYSMYVDNLVFASKTPEEAIAQNECIKAAFAAGSMNLRGQISTHPEVNKYFNETAASFNFLGHEYIIAKDVLVIGWKNLDAEKVPKTKRALLSFCASLFDLMGILEPLRLPIMLLIRQAWSQKLNWNSIMDASMIEEIARLFEERIEFKILFERKIFQNASPSSVELHIFGDASGSAYGCVAYLRYIDNNGDRQAGIIFAKSRLAPLKPVMTITKLELTATALCSHVADFLKEELLKVLAISRVVIWTDSTTVLYWINNPEGKGRYVTNRVQKLRNSGAEFMHVNGPLNPADVVSRGCSPDELQQNELWFKGPSFLRGDEALWPQQPNLEEKRDVEEAFIVAAVASKSSTDVVIQARTSIIDVQRISSWNVLRGVAANLIKFAIMKSPKFCQKMFGCAVPDGVDILKKAEVVILQQIQNSVQLDQKRLDELALYFSKGFWKKYCRIKTDDDPIYLADCLETRLLIMEMHERLNHGSVSMVLAEFNQLYYLPKARSVIKSVLRSGCMDCRKNKAVPFALPIMNNMPHARSYGKPFEYVGVDLAGPFKVKYGDSEATPHWVVLFTCFTCRAIHLELVSSLSGEAFIDALTRFASRRTMPSFIYSDNATNFKVTAATVIPRWKICEDKDVLNYCISKKIKWKFNTEKTPWAGGIYETMIKLLKRNIKITIGRRQMSLWKLLTLLAQVEAWVNCRPLTYISEDANQIILRAIDFITPYAKPGVPHVEVDVDDPDFTSGSAHENLIALWSQGQKRFTVFKDHFNKDYLKMLRDRTRHHHQSGHVINRDPRIGEIVTIHDEDDKMFWKLGIVVDLIESSDHRIRAAKVKTPSGKILQRPINHLYPLEVDDHSMKHVSQPVNAKNLPNLQLQHPNAFDHEEQRGETVDEDEHHDDAIPLKVHPMTTRHDRRQKAVNSVLVMNPMMLLICCLIACLGYADAKPCPAGVTIERVYHPSCVQRGYLVHRYQHGYCWMEKLCGEGSYMPEKLTLDGSLCEAGICSCPSWAQGCSSLSSSTNPGNSTLNNSKIMKILSSIKPGYCSLKPSPQCSDNHQKKKFLQVQLLDDSLHFVNDLHMLHQEAHEESFKCFGESQNNDADGPDEYCNLPEHVCNTESNKICVPTFIERNYLMTSEGNIEIKAWGMVPVMVYTPLEEVKVNWSTTCINGKLMVEFVEPNDVIQIDYLKISDYVKVQGKRVVAGIPRQLLMINQNVTLTLWRKGNAVASIIQECQSEDYCNHIDCYFCPELIANYECRTWSLLAFIIFSIICFVIWVIEVAYLLLRRKRGERAYWLKRLLRRKQPTVFDHKKFDDPVQVQVVHDAPVEVVHNNADVPAAGFLRYQSIHTVGTAVAICVLGALLIGYGGEAASQSISFQAKNNLCITSASGVKSCQHNTVAHYTIKNENEIAMNLEDDEGRPQASLILKVTPIAKCQRSNAKFSRLAEVQIYSSKRCPSKGSCIDSVCEDVQPNTTIAELALVNNHPGVTRCTSSCGCWGCGCFLCYDGCTFFRYYATPVDPLVYEEFSCRKWIFGANIRLEQKSSHKSEVKEFYLQEGTSIKFNQMTISLPAVRTSEVFVLKSFIHDGTRLAFGDGITSAAMNLLQCPTKNAAEKFDCSLDEGACNCLPAGNGVNCLCAQNQVLKRHLDHSSLPNEKVQIKLKDQFAYYNLEDATTDLVVETQHMEVVSQIDYNSCQVQHSSVQGCVNCEGGAFVFVQCSSDFGKSLAFVDCNPYTFSILCDNNKHVVTLDLNDTIVALSCSLKCPANVVQFNISGTLNFVHESPTVVKKSKATVEVNWFEAAASFVENLINTRNYIFIIVILVVIMLLK